MTALVKRPAVARGAALALLAAFGWILPYRLGSYDMHVVDIALLFAILAIGQGLVMGVAGQINLAQIAFFGVGAYAVAIATTHYGLGFWAAAAVAVPAAALTGLLVGLPALRVQSHYLGIVTLGLALAFLNWITNADITGGASGIPGIPVPALGGLDLSSDYLYYYLELAAFAGALAFGLFVVRTPLGRRLRAMRDDPLAAGSVGARIPVLRITVFALAGVYGGVAGVLYAGLIRFVAPETFSVSDMFLLLAMVIIGGRQSLWGCVVGALGLSIIREAFIDLATDAQLAYGTVVVLMVVFAPTGLAAIPARLAQAIRRRRAPDATQGALEPFLSDEPGTDAPSSRDEPTGADAPLLELHGITKHFRGLLALREVSLTVAPGEIRGVVGPNGSGKTTLFNVISGFYKADAGTAVLDGRAVTGARPYRLAHLGLARTFQNLRLFADLTVRENVLVALDRTRTRWSWRYLLWPVGVWRHDRELARRADELLARYGLAQFGAAAPRSLPYGIQRRVEIARAMAGSPRLLLLDEPAAGLNGEEKGQLAEIVRSIRAHGTTVVLIEHDMGLVMSLCQRVTVLASGAVIAEGTPAEVVADPTVIEAYLGGTAMAGAPVSKQAETGVEEAR